MESLHSKLDEALRYAQDYGFSVIPCTPKNKSPITAHGIKDASKNPETIRQWWETWPDANIGIACGAPSSNLIVLDIDGLAGEQSLQKLQLQFGNLPTTPRVETGNGFQYYFRSKYPIRNRVGLKPGIDIRSENGYVIAPPSTHPNGKLYKWLSGNSLSDVPIADLPWWIIQTANDKHKIERHEKLLTPLSEVKVTVGSRNETLASLAGSLFRTFIHPRLSSAFLWAYNSTYFEPPLDQTEFEKTVESIANIEAQRRLGK